MSEQEQREKFVHELKICEPTHYQGDSELDELLSAFQSVEYEAYSSLVLPENLVVDLGIAYSTKYSGYTPGSKIEEGKIFNAKHPLIIYCTKPGAEDRTLIWANGVISYAASGHITVFLDKDLLHLIERSSSE